MSWKKISREEINQKVFSATNENVSYTDEVVLGVPASYLDEKVFPRGASFLKDAPFLNAMVENPNHIGCHTFGSSEGFFSGTQQIERELIEICSEDILKAEPDSCDGYVATGGTEANIEAIWIYRNYFLREFGAKQEEIAILCSCDSHYSMDKAANLLNLSILKCPVDDLTRKLDETSLNQLILEAKGKGIKFVITVANMMTTMFGSVDDHYIYTNMLKKHNLIFKLHIDGAYGGFYYPFANQDTPMNLSDPDITSVTLDAHKMAQAPYGTGIFIIRKGFMHFAQTQQASYVVGEDCTLSGSRSGANAIAVWMILSTYGPHGWYEKVLILQKRTDWLSQELDRLKITYFRDKHSNIVTIKASDIPLSIAAKFHLVPDKHQSPSWFKIVNMDHVQIEKLALFIDELGSSKTDSIQS
jgi:tyrosine decarboxylase / aspartate 1-decarboxylase